MRQNGNAQLGPGKPGRPAFPLSRRGIIGVSAIGAMLIAAAITAISVMGGGPGTSARQTAAAGTSQSATAGHDGANSASATLMPELAAAPQVAVMPKGAAGHSNTPKASSSAKPSSSASAHPTPSSSSSSPAPSNSPTSSPPPSNGSCTHPQLVTSDPNGMLSESPYFVAQDMWNASGYSVTQTLYACSYSNWYVVATMNNDSGDGAVKTYPNAHMDFDSSPTINSFNTISSSFAESGGGSGIYEYAYDIWLNGIATSGSTEVMIWNDNHGQSPGGSYQETVSIDGRSYQVYSSGSYIAFVATSNYTSGTVNLLEFFKWLMSKGMIPSNTTMGQVDYGIELVSTNNAPETFSVNNFSVSTS